MERYNGKNIKLSIGGYDKDNDVIKGLTHYFRGTVEIDLEPKNEVLDDSLDGSLFLAEDAALPSKKRGTFSTSQLIVKDNMFSVLVAGLFNRPVDASFPLTPNYNAQEQDRVLIVVNDVVDSSIYICRPQELTIKVDGDEKFIIMETKGDIADYEDDAGMDLAGKLKVNGKPFLVNEASIEDMSGNSYAGIKSLEATFKNNMALMEVVGDDGNYLPPAFEGSGKLVVVWNAETKNKWENAMNDLTTVQIVIKAEDADGNTLEVKMPAVKILQEKPEYKRSADLITREFEFIVVDNGIDTPLQFNFY